MPFAASCLEQQPSQAHQLIKRPNAHEWLVPRIAVQHVWNGILVERDLHRKRVRSSRLTGSESSVYICSTMPGCTATTAGEQRSTSMSETHSGLSARVGSPDHSAAGRCPAGQSGRRPPTRAGVAAVCSASRTQSAARVACWPSTTLLHPQSSFVSTCVRRGMG